MNDHATFRGASRNAQAASRQESQTEGEGARGGCVWVEKVGPAASPGWAAAWLYSIARRLRRLRRDIMTVRTADFKIRCAWAKASSRRAHSS